MNVFTRQRDNQVMKTSTQAMQILQSDKDYPMDYSEKTCYAVFRQGQWINVIDHNRRHSKYKVKRKHKRG